MFNTDTVTDTGSAGGFHRPLTFPAASLLDTMITRHPLAAEGFASLGCQTCTRRIVAGENVHAGRWAGMEKTECGIHLSGGGLGDETARGSLPVVTVSAPSYP